MNSSSVPAAEYARLSQPLDQCEAVAPALAVGDVSIGRRDLSAAGPVQVWIT